MSGPVSIGNAPGEGDCFRTHDVGLATFLKEFKSHQILRAERRGARVWFLFPISRQEGEIYRIEWLNSEYRRFERTRKDLVDLAHGEK